MNLNNYMPTQLEDSTPIDKDSLDFQYSAVLEQKSQHIILHRPNLRYGLTEDMQLETQATIESGGNEDQSGEADLGLQYRLNRSRNYFPEIALSPTIIFPTGKNSRAVDYSLKLILTSTLIGNDEYPVTQIHFNYLILKNNQKGNEERSERYEYLLGVSHRLFQDTAIIFNGVVSDNTKKEDQNYLLELGVHHNLGHDFFVALSYGQGLGSSSVKQQTLLAIEKQFR